MPPASDSMRPDEGLTAGDETRTRDIDLGRVALYQLSYSRSDARFGRLVVTKSPDSTKGLSAKGRQEAKTTDPCSEGP